MRELNNTKIIAVDHGYGNIKTANTVTPTALTAYDSEPVFSGNILEYNGTYYRIGEGRKEFIPDKVADEDYYILTLMAVARELNLAGISEADVHLAAGLPLTWVRRQREDFRNYLLRNEDVQFKFKRKGYRLHFTGCSLYPQGYPAVVNRLNEFKGTNLLADIGNGTMNILYIVDKKPVESRSWTEKIGVNQCMIAARNAVMDNFGVKIEDATIEKVLRLGKADIGRYYLDCIVSAAEKYVADIFATLRRYEYNPDLMRLFITGGGGCLIRNFHPGLCGKEEKGGSGKDGYGEGRITIIDDICATAKGYEYLAYTSLRRKERV
ncbi:MAG: ParM/StbA family protein [Clostridiales bacterium]|nr:ParM/StbA family protein [Clostridiales bacterium]